MRVLVCGSRGWDNEQAIWDVLHGLKKHDIAVISGMAKGADMIAAKWAKANKVILYEFPAEWSRYGRAAGYERNERMLEEGRPDVVWAFKNKDVSKGTDMMIRIASEAGVPVFEVRSR